MSLKVVTALKARQIFGTIMNAVSFGSDQYKLINWGMSPPMPPVSWYTSPRRCRGIWTSMWRNKKRPEQNTCMAVYSCKIFASIHWRIRKSHWMVNRNCKRVVTHGNVLWEAYKGKNKKGSKDRIWIKRSCAFKIPCSAFICKKVQGNRPECNRAWKWS